MILAEIIISDRSPNGALFRSDAVYRVMVHEIGHAIGIFGHSESKDSVMYYAKVNRNAYITPLDIKYVNKLYGF
jgi:predicted Zn-dependent protease